jgi:hypothetical protein
MCQYSGEVSGMQGLRKTHGLAALAVASTMSLLVTPVSGFGQPSPSNRSTGSPDCDSLAGRSIAGAVITSTKVSGDSCIVDGALHDTLKFRLSLPTEWNGRFLYIGGGGWNGSISPLAFAPVAGREGYAIVASDSGHEANGIDASWALGNPRAQTEFAFLSVHSVADVSKAIIAEFYGERPHHSYFEGCSNGGREGLVSATRFPSDFDGIISRAPANYWSSLFTTFLRNGQRQSTPGAAISAQQASIVEAAALRQCDAQDGLADGTISDPGACHFRIEATQCRPGQTESCLTTAQVETARTFYAGFQSSDGSLSYPSWPAGGEGEGWPLWVTGENSVSPGAQYLFGQGFYKYWVTANADTDVSAIEPQAHRPALALADAMLTAGPDLRPFFDQGHKVILWHGVADWAISYRASVRYFDEVANAVGGTQRRDASMAFFLAPGVQHCAGGSGADTTDLLTPLRRWVEHGERPENLEARKIGREGQTEFSRPLCQYPLVPRYRQGDTDLASSFTCAPSAAI